MCGCTLPVTYIHHIKFQRSRNSLGGIKIRLEERERERERSKEGRKKKAI